VCMLRCWFTCSLVPANGRLYPAEPSAQYRFSTYLLKQMAAVQMRRADARDARGEDADTNESSDDDDDDDDDDDEDNEDNNDDDTAAAGSDTAADTLPIAAMRCNPS